MCNCQSQVAKKSFHNGETIAAWQEELLKKLERIFFAIFFIE